MPPSRYRWTLIHVVAHYINYAGLPDPSVMITSAAGATGHVLLLCLALMCVAALPRFRRGKHFHIFMKVHSTGRVSNKQPACLYRTPRLLTAIAHRHIIPPQVHHLFIIMLALLFFHGNQMWGPNFWKFAAFPLTLYIIEKAIRIRNAGHHAELKCLEVKKLADKVTRARAAARHV